MTTSVLLYTMRCNIACAHCSVNSGPDRSGAMDHDTALALVDGLAAQPQIRFIDISGGEPMLHPDEIEAIIRRVKSHGKGIRLTSNGFWASTPKRAEAMLRRLKQAGLDSVGLSLDKWHLEFLPANLARHFIDACRLVGFPPLVSCVLRGSAAEAASGNGAPLELRSLLDYYGLAGERATDLNSWGDHMESLDEVARTDFLKETIAERLLVNWQFLTGEGRAAARLRSEIASTPLSETPMTPCPVAGRMPTIDQAGRLFPCCAPWVNYTNRAYAKVTGATVGRAVAEMEQRPALRVIRRWGPKRLMLELLARGHSFPQQNSGICNLCGHMLKSVDLDTLDAAAEAVLGAEAASSQTPPTLQCN